MAEQKKHWVKVSNQGPGPRMLLLPEGGKTVQKNSSVVLQMTENDVKGIQPYIDLGHIKIEDATDDEIKAAQPTESRDIGGDIQPEDPLKSGNPVDAATAGGEGDIVPAGEAEDDETDLNDDENDGPTHVEHRGFGRYYGMRGDEKITQAMTEAEANAYAEEHSLQAPVTPDPAADDNVTDPGDGGSADSADETTADETDPAADETQQ